ncbi:MAG: RNA polymerase sigma factor [Candidatus Promineifilaceae bacterium]
MPVEQREARLTAQALQGNRDAFGDLYELYLEEVYRYVFYRVSNEADAEDLTEQVFLNAWENLPKFLQSVPFKAWLYRIARNTVIDHYRTRNKKNLPMNENVSFVAMDDQPEDKVLAQETTVRLIQAISKLSQLHQDVIILRFANGFSTTETAQIVERNVGTVRVLQHRALKAMQSYLVAEEIVHG